MDIFEYMREQTRERESPLAARLRPSTLEEVVGQRHIIGKDKLLYRAIKADKLSSVIFYGPPGTGKTTLAKVIANTTSADFTQINATASGKKTWKKSYKRRKTIRECMRRKRFSLLMRFTDSIKPSRIICFHLSKTAPLF